MYSTSRLLNANMYLLSFSLLIQIALSAEWGASRRQKCQCVCVCAVIEKLRNWWNNTPVGCGDGMFWRGWNGWSLLTVGNRTVHTTFRLLRSSPSFRLPPEQKGTHCWSGAEYARLTSFPLKQFSQNRTQWKKTQESPNAYWKGIRFSLVR